MDHGVRTRGSLPQGSHDRRARGSLHGFRDGVPTTSGSRGSVTGFRHRGSLPRRFTGFPAWAFLDGVPSTSVHGVPPQGSLPRRFTRVPAWAFLDNRVPPMEIHAGSTHALHGGSSPPGSPIRRERGIHRFRKIRAQIATCAVRTGAQIQDATRGVCRQQRAAVCRFCSRVTSARDEMAKSRNLAESLDRSEQIPPRHPRRLRARRHCR